MTGSVTQLLFNLAALFFSFGLNFLFFAKLERKRSAREALRKLKEKHPEFFLDRDTDSSD